MHGNIISQITGQAAPTLDDFAGKLVTAAQIEHRCPERLEALGQRIAAHLHKAERAERNADNHRTSAALLLAEAKKACTDSGFDAFRERYCPALGKTRAYEMLQIASGTKTAEEIRAGNAERNRQHRARKKAAELVRHVTESLEIPPAPAASAERREAVNAGLEAGRDIYARRVDHRLERYEGAIGTLDVLSTAIVGLDIPPNLTCEMAAETIDGIDEVVATLLAWKAKLAAHVRNLAQPSLPAPSVEQPRPEAPRIPDDLSIPAFLKRERAPEPVA